MILARQEKIRMPKKITNILNELEFPVVILNHDRFNKLKKIYGLGKDTCAYIELTSFMIFIDGEKLKKEKRPQSFINYVFLHEISHGINETTDEYEAHKCALQMAEEEDIEISYEGVILDANTE